MTLREGGQLAGQFLCTALAIVVLEALAVVKQFQLLEWLLNSLDQCRHVC